MDNSTNSDPAKEEAVDTMENKDGEKTKRRGRPSATGSNSAPADGEDQSQKVPYPKSVFFIVSNEFCERFSFYGMRTILALYLKNHLEFTSNTAIVIYHSFIMLCYFFPVLGAIISDSWLGKFRTIMYLSMVYALGSIVITIAAIPHTIPAVPMTLVGLILIAFGTGGIKPCVSAFGGDQFTLPQQDRQLQKFFSVFYFAINCGSLISTFLTPVLREIKCFEESSCFSLAFGVPAVLMVVSIIIYIGGKNFYKIKQPEGNVVIKVLKCMGHALKEKRQKKEKFSHWLDRAEEKYGRAFVDDIKVALKVLVLYIPLPFFWALFDQQGSMWTFQAERMDGTIGSFTIIPDQMQVVNPVLILVLTPLFQTALYPLLAKWNLMQRPLQKITVGGLLASSSFALSAVVEKQLEPDPLILPAAGIGQLKLYNGLSHDVTVDIPGLTEKKFELRSLETWARWEIPVFVRESYQMTYEYEGVTKTANLTVKENSATSYTFMKDRLFEIENDYAPSIEDEVTLIVVYSDMTKNDTYLNFKMFDEETKEEVQAFSVTDEEPFSRMMVGPSTYTIQLNDTQVGNDFKLLKDGVYAILIMKDEEGTYKVNIASSITYHTLHMMWLVPQYFVMTAAEVMFSITGLEFSYTQAPASMKSLFQAAWLLTVAFGNLIVVVIEKARFVKNQMYEFVLYASLMLIDMVIFAMLAMRYKYVEDIARQREADENKAN